MTIKQLRELVSQMPEDAAVLIAFDPNKEHHPELCPLDSYQPADIAFVVYNAIENLVELREDWTR